MERRFNNLAEMIFGILQSPRFRPHDIPPLNLARLSG
jgi:hypothetical protein